MKKYNNIDIDLKELQKVQLEILKEFDRICKKNNIKYQLFSGTLLGAVRHKGFIPWDDDIDLCMLRKDYNKFIQICEGQLSERYFLQTYKTDKEYIHSFARIRKNNTIALQNIYSEIDMHHGVFIDVFPMDNIRPNKIIGKAQILINYSFKKLKRFKIKKICLISRTKIRTYIKLTIHYLLKPLSMQQLNNLEEKIQSIFKNKDTKHSTCLVDGDKNVYYNYMIKNDEFYDTIEMEFEGYKFLVPRNYDEILTNNFGDYMKFPPISEQKPHHGIIEINFDTTIK